MHPARTSYLLASNPTDYRACHTLQKSLGEAHPLSFPTVYAQRAGQVIGFLSTSTRTGAVCAGPLILDPKLHRTIFTAIRLIEAYEVVLTEVGVTQYLFGISKDLPTWKNAIELHNFVSYDETPDAWWFRKDL